MLRRTLPTLITLLVALAATIRPAAAANLQIYSTGIAADGTSLAANGTEDAHWTVNGGSAYVGRYSVWTANTSTSQWITPNADPSTSYSSSATFDYLTHVNLASNSTLSTVNIWGQFSVDDNLSIKVNGTVVYSQNSSSYWNTWTGFNLTDTGNVFKSGDNTIEFIVNNNGGAQSGLQVQMQGATVSNTPEPGSLALLIGSLTTPFAVRLRRRSR
jgi:hypothetical protein